ncbi:anthranilate synthase component I family protein [Planctomycetaceae bacterium SH139]
MIPPPFAPPTDFAAQGNGSLPLIHRLPDDFSLVTAFDRLQSLPGVLWLDSVTHPSEHLGRYSFLTADPLLRIVAPAADAPAAGDPAALRQAIDQLSAWVERLPRRFVPELPPFQGGIAGLFGYELNRLLEPVPPPRYQDLATPPLAVGLYDWTLAQDHSSGASWVISQGLRLDGEPSVAAAATRIDQVLQWLAAPVWPSPQRAAGPVREAATLAPQFPTHRDLLLTSNFTAAGFQAAVAEIVESIRAGDAFQVNLAQRLLYPATAAPAELYRRLRRENPAPEAGYFDGGTFQVLSSSPETFLRVRDRQVETRPIKGTCPRSGDPQFDAQLAAELSASEKDRAENVMIVDLMRNDLSRVCTDSSVRVRQLCAVEPYAFVQHLVSVVTGQLRPEASVVDLLAACFPGGSITGAPKVEAMRKITALEQVPRGPYCGSLGYIGCGGAADFNILIRTITQADGYLQIPVGGGITAASDPASEYRETWHKAEGLLRALPI